MNAITVAGENIDHELAHRLFVFDQQDGFVAAADRNGFEIGSEGNRRLVGARQINMEGGADVQLAFDFNPALMLFNDAEYGCQAEAGAATDFLGGKERFENVRKVRRGNAFTGVPYRQADKVARTTLGF